MRVERTMATIRELELAVAHGKPLPEHVTGKLYLTLVECGAHPIPYVTTCKNSGQVLLEIDIEFDVPTITKRQIVEAQVESLEQDKRRLLAETERSVQMINERIQ